MNTPIAPVGNQGLQSVVVRSTQIHDYVYLTNPAINRQNWTGLIGSENSFRRGAGYVTGQAPNLIRRSAIKRGRSVQIDGPIHTSQMLVNVIAADEQSLNYLALCSNRKDLATRIH